MALATREDPESPEKKLDGVSRGADGPIKTPAELLERIPVMGADDTRQVYGKPGNLPEKSGVAAKKSRPPKSSSGSDDGGDGDDLYSGGSSQSDESKDSLYSGAGSSRRFGVGIFKRKKLLAGIIGGGIISVVFAFGGLLSQFKLNYLMDNLDRTTGVRVQASLDRRQLAYVRAYTEIRMMDIGGNFDKNGNHFFRVNGIKSGNPLYDWYKTLRTSNFERDVFNNNGVFFGSFVKADGTIVPGYITVDKAKISPDNMKDIQNAINGGDWSKLDNAFGDYFTKVDLANHRAGRAAIKEIVKANTQSYNVFKRRRVRKSMEQMAGIRNWRFFDESRAKATKTAKDMRNKLIVAAVPESTTSGKFLRCFFGVTGCQFSSDPDNPENLSSARDIADTGPTDNPDIKDEQGKPVSVDLGPAAQDLKNIIDSSFKTFNVVSWLSLIDSLSRVSDAIADGSITASVTVARGIQAMNLYQVFETAKDQSKTGQLTSVEMNQLMQSIANITASEAWVKAVEGKGDPTKLAALGGTAAAASYCGANHPASENEFTYLCPNARVGVSKASEFSKAYTDSAAGKILVPALKVYHKALGGFLGFINDLIGSVLSPITSAILHTINLVLPGVVNDAQKAMAWAGGQLANYLGAGPLYNSDSTTSGQLGNWLVQGAAYTQESTLRDNGAALTNSDSQKEAEKNVLTFDANETANQSIFDRYLSPSNTRSVTATGLFALSQLKFNSIGSFFSGVGSMFGTLFSNISLPFTHHVSAASTYGYAGSQIAAIPTYDYPSACFGLDPLTAAQDATAGTNVIKIMNKYGVAMPDNWVLADPKWDDGGVAQAETDSNTFYSELYKVINAANPDNSKRATNIAEQVYNCNLLDNAVRGDMGNVYGFTQDYGYDSSSTNSSNDTSVSGSSQQLAQKILAAAQAGKIKFAVVNPANLNDHSDPEDNIKYTANGQASLTSTNCAQNAPPNSSVNLSSTLLQFILDLSGSTTFTINELSGGCHTSSGSNHYKGTAVDFGCPFDAAAADQVGSKYGISDGTGETCANAAHYHYSIGGN